LVTGGAFSAVPVIATRTLKMMVCEMPAVNVSEPVMAD